MIDDYCQSSMVFVDSKNEEQNKIKKQKEI